MEHIKGYIQGMGLIGAFLFVVLGIPYLVHIAIPKLSFESILTYWGGFLIVSIFAYMLGMSCEQ